MTPGDTGGTAEREFSDDTIESALLQMVEEGSLNVGWIPERGEFGFWPVEEVADVPDPAEEAGMDRSARRRHRKRSVVRTLAVAAVATITAPLAIGMAAASVVHQQKHTSMSAPDLMADWAADAVGAPEPPSQPPIATATLEAALVTAPSPSATLSSAPAPAHSPTASSSPTKPPVTSSRRAKASVKPETPKLTAGTGKHRKTPSPVATPSPTPSSSHTPGLLGGLLNAVRIPVVSCDVSPLHLIPCA